MKQKKWLLAGLLFPVFLLCVLLLLPQISRQQMPSSDEAFSAFTRELFCREVSANTLTLHYTLENPAAYGIQKSPVTFGNYIPQSAGHGASELEQTLSCLHSIPREQLSAENQLTYDILEAQLLAELKLVPFSLYEEVFSPTIGTQAQLPILLAEYTFETLEDTDVYLELLSQLDSYYESLLWFEQEKAAAGLFMWEDTAEAVIEQCRAFIENPEENFLLSTFEERIRDLPFSSLQQKEAYLEANRRCITESVIPAYRRLIAGFLDLKGKGKNPSGLCYFPNGKEYYQALIACDIGSDRSISEIRTLLEERINTDLEIIQDILNEEPQLLEQTAAFTAFGQEASPAAAIQESPQMILETLEQKISSDFPAVSSADFQIKQVHASLESYLSPAFYVTPPIDAEGAHTIYINRAADYDSLSLFTTLAHEGYPGHLYQSLYESSCQPDPVRSLFSFGGYIEGWATYAERCSYAYTGLDPDLAELLAANNSISLGIYALADIGIHNDGWTLKETADFLHTFGIRSEETARSIYQSVLENPANYLKYYLGYVEIEKLKEQAQSALSEQFDLKEFHRFLLSTGPAPFSVLEQHLQTWIKQRSDSGAAFFAQNERK